MSAMDKINANGAGLLRTSGCGTGKKRSWSIAPGKAQPALHECWAEMREARLRTESIKTNGLDLH
jgi:hypothetical protein